MDHQKLDWINKHHLLKRAETKEGMDSLVDILKPFVDDRYAEKLNGTSDEYRLNHDYLYKVVDTIKVRTTPLKMDRYIDFFYRNVFEISLIFLNFVITILKTPTMNHPTL